MIKIHKYAAVDIGSNAVRLLISSVVSQNNNIIEVKKISLRTFIIISFRFLFRTFFRKYVKLENNIKISINKTTF